MAEKRGQKVQQNNNKSENGKSRYDLPEGIFSGIARRFDERAVKSEQFALVWAPATTLAAQARKMAEAGQYFEAAKAMWEAVAVANELELPELLSAAKAEIEAAKAWLPEVEAKAGCQLVVARDETQKIGTRVQAARAALKIVREARFAAQRAEVEVLAKATTLAGAAGATVEHRRDRRCTRNNGVRPVVILPSAMKPEGNGQKTFEASEKAKAEQAEALGLAMSTMDATGRNGGPTMGVGEAQKEAEAALSRTRAKKAGAQKAKKASGK